MIKKMGRVDSQRCPKPLVNCYSPAANLDSDAAVVAISSSNENRTGFIYVRVIDIFVSFFLRRNLSKSALAQEKSRKQYHL